MQIDVGRYIADLLFENKTVTIPGFGGFTSEFRGAAIDQVQGKLSPPSRRIHFNKNLAANDGLLVHYIKEKYNISAYEAQKAVDDYVRQLKNAIERQEIISFPKVGRLYKDYDKEIQFLPENINFYTHTFGLPEVDYQQLPKPTPPTTNPATPTAAIKDPTQPSQEEIVNEKLAGWLQKNIILVSSVAIIVVALGVFMLINNQEPAVKVAERPIVPADRYNRRPSSDNAFSYDDQSYTKEDNYAGIENTEETTVIEGEDDDISAVEAPTSAPEQKYCVIVIGIFKDKNNIEKLVEKIYNAGYEPFTERRDNLTRVGVQFTYETPSEIDRTLKKVRNSFHEDAIVYKK